MPTNPSTLGLDPSFGFGDRLGCATAGHIDALREAGGAIKGIFAQQSIREMTRTGRSPKEVMQSAEQAIAIADFHDAWGADADHLKTADDVRSTAAAGFTFFTVDPSDHVDRRADGYDLKTLDEKFTAVRGEIDWVDVYLGRKVGVPEGPTIEFDRPTVLRAAVKYGRAINHALTLGREIQSATASNPAGCEIEVSVDETDEPTSPAEHFIIADQMVRHGLPVVSLAPRFIGDFEKGVDFKGDLPALAVSLREHAAIARMLGPYKLSLHSGSDKLSMYPALAKATGGAFHVKTAGTSYMEALRVVAQCAPDVFRQVVSTACECYEADRATYHVSARVASIPAPEDVLDDFELQRIYLEHWSEVPAGQGFTTPGRQILHCTFGSILTHPHLGPLVKQILNEHPDVYREVLCEHFTRHLKALRAGM
jgi:hypothetical protein